MTPLEDHQEDTMTVVAMVLLPLVAIGLMTPALAGLWRGELQAGLARKTPFVCMTIAVGVLTIWGWLGWVA